ncbi:MAG: succinate dehydrogenase cytochrome b subunit [Myxococcaceae bacterium]
MASISAKILMALSGLFLMSFLVIHLLGNLQIFAGPEVFNAYPETLHHYPILLWSARIFLICAFTLHILTSVYLSTKNKAARPIAYAQKKSVAASLASRTMLLGGLVILGFLLFHLSHLTWRWVFPEYSNLDLYSLTVLSFQNIFVTAFYVLAQVFLALHLSHGFSSAAQTLSLTRWCAKTFRISGYAFAVTITLGYISIPVSIWLGFIHA